MIFVVLRVTSSQLLLEKKKIDSGSLKQRNMSVTFRKNLSMIFFFSPFFSCLLYFLIFSFSLGVARGSMKGMISLHMNNH